jgi:hypothetical protein
MDDSSDSEKDEATEDATEDAVGRSWADVVATGPIKRPKGVSWADWAEEDDE